MKDTSQHGGWKAAVKSVEGTFISQLNQVSFKHDCSLSCNTENDERTFQHTVVSPGLALAGSSLQFSLITFTVEAGRKRKLAVISAASATTRCTVDRKLPGNVSVAFRVCLTVRFCVATSEVFVCMCFFLFLFYFLPGP